MNIDKLIEALEEIRAEHGSNVEIWTLAQGYYSELWTVELDKDGSIILGGIE